LNEGLRDELESCYHTEARLDSFPEYARFRAKGDIAPMNRLLLHLGTIKAYKHGYERDIVTRFNTYLDEAVPSTEFRFVYLDRPLDKLKLRPDIVVVNKDCLVRDIQLQRRQQGTEAGSTENIKLYVLCDRTCIFCFSCLTYLETLQLT
jgi:hypothetical protein